MGRILTRLLVPVLFLLYERIHNVCLRCQNKDLSVRLFCSFVNFLIIINLSKDLFMGLL